MFSETDKKILQVVLVIGVVAVLGLFYYVWAVVNAEKRGLDKTIEAKQTEHRKASAELAELRKWEDKAGQIDKIVKQLEEKVKRLPRTVEARKFFSILRDCIRVTNLSVERIARIKLESMGAYSEIPYMISCRARYHDLGQFLMLVEQHREQIMRVKTLDVTNDPKRPSRHPVTLRVATFVFTQPVSNLKEVSGQ